jgi:hypothetical protein
VHGAKSFIANSGTSITLLVTRCNGCSSPGNSDSVRPHPVVPWRVALLDSAGTIEVILMG